MKIESGAATHLTPLLPVVPYIPLHSLESSYEDEGFDSLSEALVWQDRLALLACLGMGITHLSGHQMKLRELLTMALEDAAYIPDVGWSLDRVAGLAREYGVRGMRKNSYRDIDTIATPVAQGSLVITLVAGGRSSSVGSRSLLIYAVTEHFFLLHDPLFPDGEGMKLSREELLKTLSPIGSVIVLERV